MLLENLNKKIIEQENQIKKLNKEIDKIIEENDKRYILKRNGEDALLFQIEEKDKMIKKETEKMNIYRIALILKKRHVTKHMEFLFNEVIKKLKLEEKDINKRNISKIKKELDNEKVFENSTITYVDCRFRVYTDTSIYDLYNFDGYNGNWKNRVFQLRELQGCNIQNDKYYISLARNILKKQDSFNKKFFKLKTEVESYCKEIKESEQVYLSSYLKDIYNGFEFIQF